MHIARVPLFLNHRLEPAGRAAFGRLRPTRRLGGKEGGGEDERDLAQSRRGA